jgi:hypothetical protein
MRVIAPVDPLDVIHVITLDQTPRELQANFQKAGFAELAQIANPSFDTVPELRQNDTNNT